MIPHIDPDIGCDPISGLKDTLSNITYPISGSISGSIQWSHPGRGKRDSLQKEKTLCQSTWLAAGHCNCLSGVLNVDELKMRSRTRGRKWGSICVITQRRPLCCLPLRHLHLLQNRDGSTISSSLLTSKQFTKILTWCKSGNYVHMTCISPLFLLRFCRVF